MVQREGPVVAGDGEEVGGDEALVERVGKGVADPVERGVAGAIIEGQNEDESTGRRGLAGRRGGLLGDLRGDLRAASRGKRNER